MGLTTKQENEMTKNEVRAWYAEQLRESGKYTSRDEVKRWAKAALALSGPRRKLPA